MKMDIYRNAFNFGEAPDSLLAVSVATAANIPGWLTQADVLSPLAPSLAARSDTFTIRVMGESPAGESDQMSSRSWIEVTVQRLPVVKSKLDPSIIDLTSLLRTVISMAFGMVVRNIGLI